MGNFEHKNGSGSLFKNEKKVPTAPDYTGSIKDHAGKSWRLSAWVKDGNKGKFLSLAISEITPHQTAVNRGKDGSDTLPF
jgi:hypothetical protein